MSKQPLTADTLRALGWSVAVHNDYKLNGVQYTFWLFTKGDLCAKGEGLTDLAALAAAGSEILRLEGWTAAERDAYYSKLEPPGSYRLCWKAWMPSGKTEERCTKLPGHGGQCGDG